LELWEECARLFSQIFQASRKDLGDAKYQFSTRSIKSMIFRSTLLFLGSQNMLPFRLKHSYVLFEYVCNFQIVLGIYAILFFYHVWNIQDNYSYYTFFILPSSIQLGQIRWPSKSIDGGPPKQSAFTWLIWLILLHTPQYKKQNKIIFKIFSSSRTFNFPFSFSNAIRFTPS
jgi:hypothetical protein